MTLEERLQSTALDQRVVVFYKIKGRRSIYKAPAEDLLNSLEVNVLEATVIHEQYDPEFDCLEIEVRL